jgi:hypothetical protein
LFAHCSTKLSACAAVAANNSMVEVFAMPGPVKVINGAATVVVLGAAMSMTQVVE